MKIEYFKEYSPNLNRDMEYSVYGHAGKICIAFPSQNGRFFDFANNGLIDVASKWIEEGRLQVVCVDSIDRETWSDENGDPGYRMFMHECWYKHIMEEVVPAVKERNPREDGLLTTGCSMGATHAMNFYLRNPYVFDSVISLSGVYEASFFMNDYMDENTYFNSPINYIDGMSYDHPFVEQYRKGNIIMCVGQGPWEDDMIKQTDRLSELLRAKDVDFWADYWGYDIAHDWPFWRMELPYFLKHLLGE